MLKSAITAPIRWITVQIGACAFAGAFVPVTTPLRRRIKDIFLVTEIVLQELAEIIISVSGRSVAEHTEDRVGVVYSVEFLLGHHLRKICSLE